EHSCWYQPCHRAEKAGESVLHRFHGCADKHKVSSPRIIRHDLTTKTKQSLICLKVVEVRSGLRKLMHVVRGVLHSERFEFRRFREKVARPCVVQLKIPRSSLDE